MRYLALVCDYDGTVASAGRVSEETCAALGRLRRTGRNLILITGRAVRDLRAVFPDLTVFARVVAENGAVIYRPSTAAHRCIGSPPPPRFVEALRERAVEPLSIGEVIVATLAPHEPTVRAVIKEMGFDLHVIFNKGAVMVLPHGVDKATGLRVALDELGLSARECVGVGDAENDQTFLAMSGRAVAVANAVPSLKEQADLVTSAADGAGVVEVIERLIQSDMEGL